MAGTSQLGDAVYGLLLTGVGLLTPASEIAISAGMNTNLWLGLGMLALGIVILAWAKAAPVRLPKRDASLDAGTDARGRRAEPSARHTRYAVSAAQWSATF